MILAVRVAFLPGAAKGYEFLFVPRWEALLKVDTWVMAMGQAFFSLSITGSGMIVYGAYLDDKVDIPGASVRTALFDTMAALLSGWLYAAVVCLRHRCGQRPVPRFFSLRFPGVFPADAHGKAVCGLFLPFRQLCGNHLLINMFERL